MNQNPRWLPKWQQILGFHVCETDSDQIMLFEQPKVVLSHTDIVIRKYGSIKYNICESKSKMAAKMQTNIEIYCICQAYLGKYICFTLLNAKPSDTHFTVWMFPCLNYEILYMSTVQNGDQFGREKGRQNYFQFL